MRPAMHVLQSPGSSYRHGHTLHVSPVHWSAHVQLQPVAHVPLTHLALLLQLPSTEHSGEQLG
jgi:hypothetical protein